MAIRTFYWDPMRGRSRWDVLIGKALRKSTAISKNAGDAFNVDLLNWGYPGQTVSNVEDEGGRLLLVGSIAHRIRHGDVICGIGSKSKVLPDSTQAQVQIYGVRGPLTLQAFKEAGHDTSEVRFMADPGLLVGKMFPDLLFIDAVPNRISFIPHYRERFKYRATKDYGVIEIEDDAYSVAKKICESEFVYTSSLHGLIWAHALNRPALLVAPQGGEELFKYEDYFASISESFVYATDISQALKARKPSSPVDVRRLVDAIELPSIVELERRRIVV